MSNLPIGFCAWNDFQVAQHYQVARNTPGAELLVYPNSNRKQGVSNAVIAQVELPIRAVPHIKDLTALAPEYGGFVFQNRPPSMSILDHTKIIMLQYSMAKAATAYNLRWGTADLGLVYGEYSAEILCAMCPVVPIGNPRLDPYFQNDLLISVEEQLASHLDPEKPTLLYAPTWGDLSSVEEYSQEFVSLAADYNILLHPHHLHTPLSPCLTEKLLVTTMLPGGINQICYLLKLCDAVITDYSGAAFDALAVGKPLVLLNAKGVCARLHQKLHERGLEFEHREQLGTVVHHPEHLSQALRKTLCDTATILGQNTALRDRCFSNRGTSGEAGARTILRLLQGEIERSEAQQYLSYSIVESFRSAELQRKQLHASRKATKLAKADLARWRHDLAARNGRSYALRLARRGLQALKMATKVTGRFILSKSALLRSLHQRMPYYRARHSVKIQRLLTKAFDSLSVNDFVTARSLFHKVLELDPQHRESYYNLFVIEACAGQTSIATGHWQKAGTFGHLGDEPIRFLCRNDLVTDGLMSAERYIARTEENKPRGLRGFRVLTAAFPFPDRVRVNETRRAVDLVLRAVEAGDFAHFKRLVQLGLLSEVTSSAARFEHTEVQDYVKNVSGKVEKIDWLLRAAGKNELLIEDQRKVHDAVTGAAIGLAGDYANTFVELFIPDSFLSPFGEDGWGSPRVHTLHMWCTILEALRDLNLVVVPRLQTSFYARPSTESSLTISHHTVGPAERNLRVKLSAFPGFFTMDATGYSGWAEFRQHLRGIIHDEVPSTRAEARWEELYAKFVLEGITKFPQAGGAAQTKEEYVFVPLQVADDTVSSLAHMSQRDMLTAAAEGAAAAGLFLIAKRHPLCKSYRVQHLLGDLAQLPHVEVSDAPIHSLIRDSVGVVTVNSGVGFEALMHLKPVITVGDADYDSATLQIRNSSELTQVISNRSWEYIDVEERKKWLSYVFDNILVESRDIETAKHRILLAINRAQERRVRKTRIANVL